MPTGYFMTETMLERIRELHGLMWTDQEIADDIGMDVSSIGKWRREVLKLESHYQRDAKRPKHPPHQKPQPRPKTHKRNCLRCRNTFILPTGRFLCDACNRTNTSISSSSMGQEGSGGGMVQRYAGQG